MVLRRAPRLQRLDLTCCPLVTRAAAGALLDASRSLRLVTLDGEAAAARNPTKPAAAASEPLKGGAVGALRKGERVAGTADIDTMARYDQRRRHTRHELQQLQHHCSSAGTCTVCKLLVGNLDRWLLKPEVGEHW